jgi:hypothetical protein
MERVVEGILEFRGRIALIVAGCVAVFCFGGWLATLGDEPAVARPPAAATPAGTAAPSGIPSRPATSAAVRPEPDGLASDEQLRRADLAAWRFAQAYVDHSGTDEAWLAGVRPYVTSTLGDLIASVDRTQIPDAPVTSHKVTAPGDVACYVTVELAQGDRWVLTVVRQERGWKVSDITPEAR